MSIHPKNEQNLLSNLQPDIQDTALSVLKSSESDSEIFIEQESRFDSTNTMTTSIRFYVTVVNGHQQFSIGEIHCADSTPSSGITHLTINLNDHSNDVLAERTIRHISSRLFASEVTMRIEVSVPIHSTKMISALVSSGYTFEGVRRNRNTSHYSAETFDGHEAIFSLLRNDGHKVIDTTFPRLNANFLRDELICLRIAKATDAEYIWSEQANKESAKWGLFKVFTLEDIRSLVGVAELNGLVGSVLLLTIEELESKKPVGKIVIRNVVPPNVGDVGYGIIDRFRGKGYATRALRILRDWAFNQAGYARLELGIKEGNLASVRVAENSNFIFESVRSGRLKNADGSYSNELHYYSLNPNITLGKIS